jgi:hypothetical protein
MNDIQKRFLLFIFGCIASRTIFMLLAKNIGLKYLPLLGYLAILPAIGFMYIFVTGSRQTGGEVFGEKIWWNSLRPVHAVLYGLFAYNAIGKNRNAWMYLLIDVLVGLTSFIYHHYKANSFGKLL